VQAAKTETRLIGILRMSISKLKDEESNAENAGPVLKLKHPIYNFHFTILATRGMEESRGTVYWISL